MNNYKPAKTGKLILSLVLVFSLLGLSSAALVKAQTTEDGNNVSINGTVYFIQSPSAPNNSGLVQMPSSTLTGYSSAAVFSSYGFNKWHDITNATGEDKQLSIDSGLMPYQDGSLVNDNGMVYLISNGEKYGISSNQDFQSLGYRWANVIKGTTSFIANAGVVAPGSAHMPGSLIIIDGTIYYISNSGRMGFPTIEVFNSWGFKLANVVSANSGDLSLPINPYNPVVLLKTLNQLSPSENNN